MIVAPCNRTSNNVLCRFAELTSGGGDRSAVLQRIAHDQSELAGVRALAAEELTGTGKELEARFDAIAASCQTEAEFEAKLLVIVNDSSEGPGVRRAASKRLDRLLKAIQERNLLKVSRGKQLAS